MITKPTVFILGAGVSMPYGFPSGRKLVEQMYIATQSNISYSSTEVEPQPLIGIDATRQIIYEAFGKEETERFGKALFLSNQTSIDAFLEHRTEFTEVGKLAIALFILGNEFERNLFNFKNRDQGCYQYLFSKMNTSWNEFSKNKVSFITFNYDRSLEHFLFTSLQNTYDKSEEDCASQINNIPIIHVHGYLGKLPWQNVHGIPYGTISDSSNPPNRSAFNANLAIEASKQIKVIPDDQTNSAEFQSAYELMSEAEHIYFLGFGYHTVNLARLQILELPTIKSGLTDVMRGSGMGVENSERTFIEKKWKINIFDTTSDSLRFLRRYTSLET